MTCPPLSEVLLPVAHPHLLAFGQHLEKLANERESESDAPDWCHKLCSHVSASQLPWAECKLKEPLASAPWLASLPERERTAYFQKIVPILLNPTSLHSKLHLSSQITHRTSTTIGLRPELQLKRCSQTFVGHHWSVTIARCSNWQLPAQNLKSYSA